MGKWYDWYENQKQWDKMLNQVDEATRSSVQERSDTHEASEKAKYDYPWKKLPSGNSLGGGKSSGQGLSLKNVKQGFGTYENITDLFSGSDGGEEGGSGILDWVSDLFGGGGGEGGESASSVGEGASSMLGWLAVIAGAALGQDAAAGNIDREVEGQKAGGAFQGHFMTEPWYAKLGEQWGWDVTAGEKFDAAAMNADWGTALRRLPAAADYWANPITTYIGDAAKNQWGDLAGGIFNPTGLITDWFD